MLEYFIYTINIAILCYFILLSIGYIFLLITAFPDIIHKFNEMEWGDLDKLVNNKILPPISIIVPVYNMPDLVMEAIYSLINSRYPNIEILVVNDGSTDDTLQRLIKKFDLLPTMPVVHQKIKTAKVKTHYISKIHDNLVVIDKEHSGTGDTLNVGINASHSPIFASLDADTVIEPEAIGRMIFNMLYYPHTIVVGGAVYILNGCKVKNGELVDVRISKNLVVALQSCEYLRSFLYGRAGWNLFGGALSYAGAFTLFEREIALDIGGYMLNNYAQDAEIIVHLHAYMRQHKYPYKIHFTPTAFAWTDVPDTLKRYWRQRNNWQDGLLRSFMPYLYMLFNPRYGVVGLFSYPFYLFFEVGGALVEFTAYLMVLLSWWIGILDVPTAILFILLAWGFATFLTMANLLINFLTFNRYRRLSYVVVIFILTTLESFGFRQYLALCRTIATIKYFFRKLFLRGKGNA